MAVTPLKAERIAGQAVAILQREIVLPKLIDTFGSDAFIGAKNDTVTRRIAARTVARTKALRATGANRVIQTDDMNESSISITLTDHFYSAMDCTDENMKLDEISFGEQILAPQARAVAEALENAVYDVIAGATYTTGLNVISWTGAGATTDSSNGAFKMATHVGKILDRAFVPQGGRILLVNPDAYEAILNDKNLRPGPNSTGLGDSALRNAIVGQLANLTVVNSPMLDSDEAYAFTRTAYTQAIMAPPIPDSQRHSAATFAYEGIALRWLRDYDPTITSERSMVDCWHGAKSVEDGVIPTGISGEGNHYNARAVKINITY